MVMSTNQLYEAIPIVLAITALVVSLKACRVVTNPYQKAQAALGAIISALLVVAQASWFSTLAFGNTGVDVSSVDNIWSFFNSLVMILVISYTINHTE